MSVTFWPAIQDVSYSYIMDDGDFSPLENPVRNGVIKTEEPTPELNVSNSNAYLLAEVFGWEVGDEGFVGTILNKDVPAFMETIETKLDEPWMKERYYGPLMEICRKALFERCDIHYG